MSGRGQVFWPRPGGLFAASPRHSLLLLASAVDDVFSRWDRQRDYQFWLSDSTRAGDPDSMSAEDEDMELAESVKLARLGRGERFVYESTSRSGFGGANSTWSNTVPATCHGSVLHALTALSTAVRRRMHLSISTVRGLALGK